MRTITRFGAAILAAIGLSAPLLAAPAASWVNFGGDIDNNNDTITCYGSSVNTATVTGGTWNAEGGYLQLGDSTTPTDGFITLQLPATITSATTVTVMLDVAGIPTTDATLIQLSLSSGGKVSLKATSSQLKQVWSGNSNDYGTLEYASEARTPRQMIALAYSSASGTNTFIDGVQKITNSGLKASNNTISAITIGVVQGLKVYGIYLYASQLSATQVATEMTSVQAELVPNVSVSMTRNGAADDNTIKVATLRKGATSSVADFEATFGTKSARSSANPDEAATFFKGSWSSCVNTNVKSGYPMVCNKFTNADSTYYWRLWVPITLESTDVFNEVLPELYPTTSGGGDQGADATFFNYTISLYEGTVVEGTTAEPIATATGTTSSTRGLNTARATLRPAISGRSGEHTLKIEVKPNTCGNEAYSGIRSVHFFNRTTASRTVSGDSDSWSTGWTGDSPVYGADVTLNVSDAATLSMDTTATLASLTVNDVSADGVTPSLTFTAGASSLTSAKTTITSATTTLNVDTDVSAITANLGAVTVAADKTFTTGPNTTMTGVTFGSATAKVKVTGSTPLSAIPYGMLSKTGTVEIKPTINLSGNLSFNTAQTLTYSADVNALRLVVGDSSSANATITQVGGTITLSSKATACNNTTASAILLGHWPKTTTYNLQGGTISAPNGALCLGWDGVNSTITVGKKNGTKPAKLKIYGLKYGSDWMGARNNPAKLLIQENGLVEIGEGGIDLSRASNHQVELAGGTLLATATASANIAHANGLKVAEPSTIAADPSATLTINKVSGAGNLTIGKAGKTGTVVISDLSAYTGTATASTGMLDLHSANFGETQPSFAVASDATLILPAGKEGTMTVPANATLRLVLSDEQLLENYTTRATINGTLNFVKRNAEGTIVELDDAEDGTVSGSTFTTAVNTWQAAEGETTGTWRDTACWSRKRLPTANESAKILLNRDTTLTVDVAAPCSMLRVTGTGTLTLAGSECLTIANKLWVTANVGLTATATNLAPVAADVAEGATFSYESGAVTLPALTGSGTFVKTGANTLTLSAANSYEPAITVSSGTLFFDSSAVHSQAYRVTVQRGAFVQVGDWAGGLTNSAASLKLEAGGTLKLVNGNLANWNSPFAAKVVVDSAATVDNPAIIQAGTYGDGSKISGSITSSGETAGVLRLEKLGENKVSLTGGITNVHLINKDMKKLEISGQISGGSSLTVKGGQVTLSNTHNYTGATTVETNGTLILAGGADTLSTDTSNNALVTVNGTLQAKNNGDAPTTYYRQTEGTGVIYVPADQTLAIGLTDHAGESGLTNFTGTLRVAGIFDARNWKAETTYTISGFNIDFEGNKGVITKHKDAKSAAVTIAAGKTLSGTGTINVPVTFANDSTATMDSEANITFGSTLTVPKNVKLPGRVNLASTAVLSGAGKLLGAGELSGVVSFAEGATIDATTSTVEQMLKFTGTPTFAATIPVKVAGLCSLFSVPKTVNLTAGQVRLTWAESAIAGSKVMLLTVFETTMVRLFVPPTVSVSEDPESPRDAGVDEAITKAAETSAEWGVVISKVTAISATGTDGKSTRDVNAAALFDGVLSLTPVGNHKEDGTSDATATVTYDFGVSDITVKSANLTGSAQLYVVVCAKVSNATGNETNTADYANDTTVSLWLNNAAADGALDPKTLSTKFGLTAGTGEKWFAVPLKNLKAVTNNFTVKATK